MKYEVFRHILHIDLALLVFNPSINIKITEETDLSISTKGPSQA